jgi:hypothetical protein
MSGSLSAPIGAVAVRSDKAIIGVYSHMDSQIPGTVGAKELYTLFNPAASGRTVHVVRIMARQYAAAAATALAAARMHFLTSSSGGVLVPAIIIPRYKSGYPDPVAESRTGNPTVTIDYADSPFNSIPSPIVMTAVGSYSAAIYDWIPRIEEEEIELLEGEGIGFRTNSGDVDQRYDIGVTWLEY